MHIEWDDKYCIGHSEIDAQQKKMFEIMNTGAKDENCTDLKQIALVRELLQYAKEHFATEESYMQEIGYPNLQEHKEEHKKMADAVEILIVKLYSEGPIDVDIFEKFTESWIIKHVLQKDCNIKDFVENNVID
ncbi:bacteriohemerythrin [Maridesulfovibrio frigidus]|uniref:bacteriohemerythrin n=1 Tax=Maridesulfovibrio frigidus TaxID=340956 RepID=UPI0004E16784|nr:bacteriohemerythrin [Maridesulfovibrio frigidus]